MRILVALRSARSADVVVEVHDNSAGPVVKLLGIVVDEARPAFFTLYLPPLEDWLPALSFLDEQTRSRVDDVAFYPRLRDAIVARFLEARDRCALAAAA